MAQHCSITILIPLFNSLRYGESILSRALQSAIDQTYDAKLIKIICLDDGSTDGTLNFLNKWASLYTSGTSTKKREIKIISRPNKGVINTIIELISYVDTDYFTILESDDYLDKQAIEKFLLATQDGTVDIVGSKWLHVNNPEIKKAKHFIQPFIDHEIHSLYEYWMADTRNIRHFWWARIYRTNFIKSIDLSILSAPYKYYPEDLPFCCYVLHFVKTFVFIPEVTYNYCYYGTSDSRIASLQRDINILKFFINILPVVKSNYDLTNKCDLLLNDYLLTWTKRGLKKRVKRVLNS